MEINKLPDNPSELKDLLKAREKYYHEAIKNNVKFDKIKVIEESIKELKRRLSTRKSKEEL
jgi:glutaredoxin-related protein